jgi:hypothetical protein
VRTTTAGAFDLVAVNATAFDRVLPASFEVGAVDGCEAGDAINHYRREAARGKLRYSLDEPALLAAGERRLLGWVRCEHGGVAVDVHAQ